MKYKKLYPITIPLVENHPRLMAEIFKEVKPHKDGCYVGVALLEGSYYIKDSEKVFESLVFGERLSILPLTGSESLYSPPLLVCRDDGTELGYIPNHVQAFLNMMLERKIDLYAYCEAMSYTSSVLKIAVSIYCEKY